MKSWLKFSCYTVGLSCIILLSLHASSQGTETDSDEETPRLEVARSDALPGMPDVFHLAYTTDSHSFSPDRKYAMIYPNGKAFGNEERKNYLACLHPLRILSLTAVQYYPNMRHGGDVFFCWSKDSKTALIGTMGRLMGATSVELYELKDGQVVRYTDLLEETMRLAEPDFRRSGAKPQGEAFHFSETSGEDFDSKPNSKRWRVDDQGQVKIACTFSNAAEGEITEDDWNVEVQATWNVKEHRFTQQRVKRIKK